MAVLWGHANDPVPAASGRNPDLPQAVDGVFEKALAKDPEKRYGSCRELIEGARDALGVTGIEVPRAPRSRRALLGVAAALALALGAAAVLAVFLTRGGGASAAAAGGTLVRIDPATNEVAGTVRVGEGASAVSASDQTVWVAAYQDGSLWQVNPDTLGVTKIPAQGSPVDLAVYGATAYVAADGATPFSATVTAYAARNGRKLGGVELFSCVGSITAGAQGVWATPCPRIQRVSFSGKPRVVATVDIPFPSPHDAAHDLSTINDLMLWNGSLWAIGDAADRTLWRIDPRSTRILQTIELPFPPLHVAAGEGAVWVTDQLGDVVARIDPATGRIAAMIHVGRGASGVAVGAGSVWATSFLDGTVSRIDPRTNRVVATIRVRGGPRDVAVGAGSVWTAGDGA
jgi:YVTN family beta-propeller protein